MLVAEVEQMLGGRVHAVFVVDTDGGVESVDGRRVDADDRHADALELFDLFLVDGEGRHEHASTLRRTGRSVKNLRRMSAVSMCWKTEMS